MSQNGVLTPLCIDFILFVKTIKLEIIIYAYDSHTTDIRRTHEELTALQSTLERRARQRLPDSQAPTRTPSQVKCTSSSFL